MIHLGGYVSALSPFWMVAFDTRECLLQLMGGRTCGHERAAAAVPAGSVL